ncbi:hypothetical protein ACTXGQ_04385 [Marinobacter sp. 1Y8]
MNSLTKRHHRIQASLRKAAKRPALFTIIARRLNPVFLQSAALSVSSSGRSFSSLECQWLDIPARDRRYSRTEDVPNAVHRLEYAQRYLSFLTDHPYMPVEQTQTASESGLEKAA